MVHLFIGVSDGHAAITTLLRLDASFPMAPRALYLGNLAAPEASPVPACTVILWPKPPKPSIFAWPPRDLLDVGACPVSTKPLTL